MDDKTTLTNNNKYQVLETESTSGDTSIRSSVIAPPSV